MPWRRRLYRGSRGEAAAAFGGGNEDGGLDTRAIVTVSRSKATTPAKNRDNAQTDDLSQALPQIMSLMKLALRGLGTARVLVNPWLQNSSRAR